MLSASSRPTVMRSSAARRTTTVRAQATQVRKRQHDGAAAGASRRPGRNGGRVHLSRRPPTPSNALQPHPPPEPLLPFHSPPAPQKPNLAQAVVAVIATAVIAAAPVFAEPDTKQAVCASNPTA